MIRTLNREECQHILTNNYIGNLAYIRNNLPYIVPITYLHDAKNNVIISYSGEGHKVSAMRKNSSVSLGVTDIDSVNHWKSIIVHGQYEELSQGDAKAYLHEFSLGVKDLIIRKEGRNLDFISEFSSKIYDGKIPVIFVIRIEHITGKMRRH